MSVINMLFKEFGENYSFGGGQICPVCGKRTFSIKSDVTLAKCFHPSCGIFVADKNMTKADDIE